MQSLLTHPLQPALLDPIGRSIGYLRLSLTAACSMRCTYCRPRAIIDGKSYNHMSHDIIEMVVSHLVRRWGVTKVRLTGGEPTARPDLLDIIGRLSRIDGLCDLAMTTNGLTLPNQAVALRQAGLKRLNISLDSLRTATFERITGVRGPDRVIEGIHAALAAGLTPIRLNTVVLAGINDDELPDLVRFAANLGAEIRFIELMPMGPLADQWTSRYLPAAMMRRRLEPFVRHWHPIEQGHGSANRFEITLNDECSTTIGFISPMSCNFCATCDRLRLASNGDIYPCLMDQPSGNILSALTPHFNAESLDRVLIDALQGKAREHPVNGFTAMTVLGG